MQIQAERDPNALLAVADAFDKEGRLEEAEGLYRQLLASYPGQPVLMHRLALVLKSRGVPNEAESLFRRAIAAAPHEASLHNNLGNLLRDANRFTDAEARYLKAIELDPAYAEAFHNLGVVLEDQLRLTEALDAYAKALVLRPGYAQARTRMGAIHSSQGTFAEALVELDAAAAVDPRSFETHYYRGLALAGLERFDEAVDALTLASSLRAGSVEARVALANNLKASSRYDEALTALWSAMELQPLAPQTHDELNQLAWTTGRKDLFLTSFAYVRQRFGDDPALLYSEAKIRLQSNDANGALTLLQKARTLSPERGNVNAMLGRLNAHRGDFVASYEALATAVRVEPDVAEHRNAFGYALLMGKEPTNALEQFAEARRINPLDQLALGGTCLGLRALGDSRYRELVNIDAFVRVYPLAIPSGFVNTRSFNAALAEELLKLHTTKTEPLEQTLRGGTQTGGLLFTRKTKIIEQLREKIGDAIANYVGEMSADETHPLLSRRQEQFSFTHSWSCKLRSSGFHTNHVHPMGWISSAYYVSLPDEMEDQRQRQGWLKFGASNLELGDDDRPEHFVQPIVGHLVLFPSYFWHGTVPFSSEADRLTVAFDVVPGTVDPRSIAPSSY